MRHGEHVRTPTVAEVVHRAVAVTDPDGTDDALAEFEARFEDRDEPVTALGDLRTREFFEMAGRLEGATPDPNLRVAGAVATYLAFRRDEVTDDDEDLLRLAVKAEYGNHPPPEVQQWLDEAGIEL
jgi:hypothetical protein